jgi:hypothetical protein
MFYIKLEDLAANAFIQSLKINNTRFLTFMEIESYGKKVIKHLQEHGKDAILILSRNDTNMMFQEYNDFFEEHEENGRKGIQLKTNITLDDLIQQFHGYLPLDVLYAFINVHIGDNINDYIRK